MMGSAALLCVVSLLEAVAGSALDNGSRRRPPAATSRALVVARERRLTSSVTTADYAWVVRLAASDAAAGDRFGDSVAIDGNTIVVGAYRDDIDGGDGSTSGQGSVYVLRTTDGGATYGQVAKLTASDAASGDSFGRSVAISGGTIVVGAHAKNDGTGAAYVFRTSDGGATYVEVAKLMASDAAAGDGFGVSVAIDGTTVVVGASGKDSGDDCTYAYDYWSGNYNWSGDDCDHGAVYVFLTTDGGATYDQVAKLTAADAAANDQFGISVAINKKMTNGMTDGGTVVIGAGYDNIDGGHGGYQIGQGSAYVFRTGFKFRYDATGTNFNGIGTAETLRTASNAIDLSSTYDISGLTGTASRTIIATFNTNIGDPNNKHVIAGYGTPTYCGGRFALRISSDTNRGGDAASGVYALGFWGPAPRIFGFLQL